MQRPGDWRRLLRHGGGVQRAVQPQRWGGHLRAVLPAPGILGRGERQFLGRLECFTGGEFIFRGAVILRVRARQFTSRLIHLSAGILRQRGAVIIRCGGVILRSGNLIFCGRGHFPGAVLLRSTAVLLRSGAVLFSAGAVIVRNGAIIHARAVFIRGAKLKFRGGAVAPGVHHRGPHRDGAPMF